MFWWKICEVKGCASYRFVHKLRAVKNIMKIWAKTEREQSKLIFDLVLAQISELDSKEDAIGQNEEERGRRRSLELQLESYLKDEELLWRQKSREKWLEDGTEILNIFMLLLPIEDDATTLMKFGLTKVKFVGMLS